ncbi:hypothetical protein AGMMS4957_13020 [Bacteroidia bacterium]|nr:hypothetical protein AGMMS4957_13020 [Bacteroidia bacterium]
MPAYKFLWSKEDMDAGHFRRYTVRELKNKLKEAGFETVYSTYIFSLLPLPILFFRALPSLLGFRVGNVKDEHQVNKKGFMNKILNKIWNLELKRISKTRKIPFGGSCLIVAKKIKNSDDTIQQALSHGQRTVSAL